MSSRPNKWLTCSLVIFVSLLGTSAWGEVVTTEMVGEIVLENLSADPCPVPKKLVIEPGSLDIILDISDDPKPVKCIFFGSTNLSGPFDELGSPFEEGAAGSERLAAKSKVKCSLLRADGTSEPSDGFQETRNLVHRLSKIYHTHREPLPETLRMFIKDALNSGGPDALRAGIAAMDSYTPEQDDDIPF